MANKDTSKLWFETGDFPTEAQFAQVFEWLRWKDESLAISDMPGLQEVLNTLANPKETFVTDGGVLAYQVPIGFLLEKIIVFPASNAYPFCAYAGGVDGDIIFADSEVITPEGKAWVVNIMAGVTAKNIVVSALPAASTVVIIKRKIL